MALNKNNSWHLVLGARRESLISERTLLLLVLRLPHGCTIYILPLLSQHWHLSCHLRLPRCRQSLLRLPLLRHQLHLHLLHHLSIPSFHSIRHSRRQSRPLLLTKSRHLIWHVSKIENGGSGRKVRYRSRSQLVV